MFRVYYAGHGLFKKTRGSFDCITYFWNVCVFCVVFKLVVAHVLVLV